MNDVKEFLNFEDSKNVYVMFAIARSKSNSELTAKKQIVIRKVIRHMEHFEHGLEEMRAICKERGHKFYIYISVNSRSTMKGYAIMKHKMCDMENHMMMGDIEQFRKYLGRVDKEWYSALMQTNSKATKYHMLDVDVPNENFVDSLIEMIEDQPHSPKCHVKRRSRNGWHVVVDGFDSRILEEFDDVEVNKDGLLFLDSVGFDD